MKIRWLSALALLAAGALPAAGQTQQPTRMVMRLAPMQRVFPDRRNAPYSGEQVGESVRTLADGTHLTSAAFPVRCYRDSQGRTRRETLFSTTPGAPPTALLVEIRDSTHGAQIFLDVARKVAHRYTSEPFPAYPDAAPGHQPVVRVVGNQPESLGTQVIDGLAASGQRSTTTMHRGQVGNDQPLVSTTETWTALDLPGVVLLSKSSSPQSGEFTERMTNIDRAEPPAELFQIPAGYQLIDEAQPITVELTYYR